VQSLTGRPFISTMHNPWPAGRLSVRTTFFGSIAVAVSTEIQSQIITDYGVDPDRVRVVLPGTDADHFRPPTADERRLARERFGIAPGQFVLAFIGSLITRKRPDTVIDAIADLVGRGRDVVALLAGKGFLEEELRARAASSGVGSNVRFLGHHDAREVLWASDALVLPSESEGFGLVLAEAMLCGVIAMRTPVGGADQFTPDVTGIVFGVGDHEELARRVEDLIDRPDFREAMIARALEDSRARFSSAYMGGRIEELYMEAVNGRR
jgi:glycosyltransferase involved in cell wall biosynthesis